MLKLHHRRTAITVLLLHHRLHCYPGIRSCIFVSTKSLLCRDPVRKPKGRRWCVWRNTSLLVVFDAHATFIREVESAPKRVFARQKKNPTSRLRRATKARRLHSSFFIATLLVAMHHIKEKKPRLSQRLFFFSRADRSSCRRGSRRRWDRRFRRVPSSGVGMPGPRGRWTSQPGCGALMPR